MLGGRGAGLRWLSTATVTTITLDLLGPAPGTGICPVAVADTAVYRDASPFLTHTPMRLPQVSRCCWIASRARPEDTRLLSTVSVSSVCFSSFSAAAQLS